MPKLRLKSELPENFLFLRPKELGDVLEGPTLFKLEGEKKDYLYLSVLLHGNETSGFTAVQRLLRKYQNEKLPRSILLLIGNVEAASQEKRFLDHQLDFNRIWAEGDSEYHSLAQDILSEVTGNNVFASVDIHNNTGKNPLYACVNKLQDDFFVLASMFSKTVIFFEKPHEVHSMAFSKHFPSVTIECGTPDSEPGVHRVFHYIDQLLQLDSLEGKHDVKEYINVYRTFARIKIDPETNISFEDGQGVDLLFHENLDDFNFTVLEKGTSIGLKKGERGGMTVLDDEGQNIVDDVFDFSSGKNIKFKREVIPSMFSKDIQVIQQDCLGYLMEKVNLSEKPS